LTEEEGVEKREGGSQTRRGCRRSERGRKSGGYWERGNAASVVVQ